MKHYFNLLLIIGLFTVTTGCDKDDNPVGPNNNEDFVYPLQVGNQWEYSRISSTFNFRPNTSNNNQLSEGTTTSSVMIQITKNETINDSVETCVLQETVTGNNRTFVDESCYANRDSGLYFYAYHGSGNVIPKALHHNQILFKGRYFNNVREIISYITKAVPGNYVMNDSLTYEIPPLLSLKYPLEKGSQWTYRYPGQPWRIDKKITGDKKVRVPAGTFVCFKIQWLYDMDHDNEWDNDIVFYDYVCEKGLIKRSVLIKNQMLTGEDGPEPIGLIDSMDESVLTGLSL